MTSEQPQASTKSIFFSLSSVMFAASIFFQIYFFLVLNDILSEKEDAMDVLEAILEALLLLSPTLTLATITMGGCLLCGAISWFRKETLRVWLTYMIPAALLDVLAFVVFMTFGYNP